MMTDECICTWSKYAKNIAKMPKNRKHFEVIVTNDSITVHRGSPLDRLPPNPGKMFILKTFLFETFKLFSFWRWFREIYINKVCFVALPALPSH